MQTIINENVGLVGICHTLIFDGSPPTWEAILSFVHGLSDAPPNLVSHDVYKNKLNDRAIAASAKFWVDGYAKTPTQIKLGTGSVPVGQTGPLSTDEDCWTPDNTTKKTVDLKTTFMTIYSEFGYTYKTTEANGTYTEAVLLDPDNLAWAHVVINFVKTSSQTGVVLWKISHTQP